MVTVNEVGDEDAVPPGAVTVIKPFPAPLGTVALICPSSVTENAVAAVPLNFTAVAPVNPAPVIVTTVPTGPLDGLKPVIDVVVAVVTVNDVGDEDAVPPGAVTVMKPFPAPLGTVALICPSSVTENAVAAVPLNFTAVAPVNPAPVMVTTVPTGPLDGLKPVIDVAVAVVTVNDVGDEDAVPPGAVTVIKPFPAPLGTVALICPSSVTENVVAAVPLNFTAVAPVNPAPVMVTTVPTGPLDGLKPVIDVVVGEPVLKVAIAPVHATLDELNVAE